MSISQLLVSLQGASHIFALFCPEVNLERQGESKKPLELVQKSLIHRIKRVLRLQIGEHVILFNAKHYVLATITSIADTCILVSIQELRTIEVAKTKLCVALPLLKKESLEDACYSMAELGAHEIQLIITEKSRKFCSPSEFERLERICIAAAEQAKNFAIPHLRPPIPFGDLLQKNKNLFILDPNGPSLFSVLSILKTTPPGFLVFVVGPEGGLTQKELSQASEHGAALCALGPTVLRAKQAIAVAVGAVRSLM